MDLEKIVELNERNIRQALEDYAAHTNLTATLDDISDDFIHQLAVDNAHSKQELRELFRKSPVWNEELQALVINGTRTHNPDYNLIYKLARKILYAPISESMGMERHALIVNAIYFFTRNDEDKTDYIKAIKALAPKAYAEGKKPSRIFKALCKELGVADETAGSDFQRLYAQFADELSSKKIGYKLYVSINPAHFLTMSNPKGDNRGCTMTSCHSLNSTDYSYNNGCSGYARDKYTFIVFTVADPSNPETFNNRKTTRQIFAYKPGNGLLMQSRLYNTSGGTRGAQEESKLYRDLVQREISALEDVPNLWKTYPYLDGKESCVTIGDGFGGYADWTFYDFDGKVSIRNDHENDYEPLEVGTYGLCICCGTKINHDLYCDDCDGGDQYCDDCGSRFHDGDLTRVHNSCGREIYVCEDCLRDNYYYCDQCGDYYHTDCITAVGGGCYCPDCLEEYFTRCEECGEWIRNEDVLGAIGEYGDWVYVCDDCIGDNYTRCECCGNYVHNEIIETAHNAIGKEIKVCESCLTENFKSCEECGEWFASESMKNGHCESCRGEEENETTEREVTVA